MTRTISSSVRRPAARPHSLPGGKQNGAQKTSEEGANDIDRERERDDREHLRVHDESPWLAHTAESVAEAHRPQSDDVRTVKPVAVAVTVALPPGLPFLPTLS